MSYIHELAAMRGADYMPSGTQALAVEQACAEVDRLRAALKPIECAGDGSSPEFAKLFEGAVKSPVYWTEIVALLRADLLAARADAERATVRYAELKRQIEVDNWSAEMQRALDFIPGQFVGNDAWENGVKRLADAWAALTAERDELRKDKERLDWIGSRASTEQIRYATAGWAIRKARIGEEDLLKHENIHDLRAAIDAARATPTGGAGEGAK